MRILIAEDETIIRMDLRSLLESAGFEVCAEAKDGEEAVELARKEQPDLAVLDVKMPRLDGIEAARRILDERPIPIVMVTAYGERELVARAVEAGVFGYLVKPFRETDLLPAIETARARHDELQALREEAESLADALAARKVIERAKGLLMTKEGLSEQDAFARLRKASQVSGRPLKVVAEAVVATLDRPERAPERAIVRAGSSASPWRRGGLVNSSPRCRLARPGANAMTGEYRGRDEILVPPPHAELTAARTASICSGWSRTTRTRWRLSRPREREGRAPLDIEQALLSSSARSLGRHPRAAARRAGIRRLLGLGQCH